MVPTHSHKPWTKTTVFWMKHLLYLHLLNIKISGWLCGMYTQQSYWQQAMYACFNKTVQRWKLFHPSKWMYVVIFWFYEVSWWSFHTKMTKWQKKILVIMFTWKKTNILWYSFLIIWSHRQFDRRWCSLIHSGSRRRWEAAGASWLKLPVQQLVPWHTQPPPPSPHLTMHRLLLSEVVLWQTH